MTFNALAATSISNIVGNWLGGVDPKTIERIHFGICALLKTVCKCRNDYVFNKVKIDTYLQVIYRASGM